MACRSARAASSQSPRLPSAPKSIAKGSTLRDLLDREAIGCLAHNLFLCHPSLDRAAFDSDAQRGLGPLGLMDRGQHLAQVMRRHLPSCYQQAVAVMLESLTPPANLGLGGFFYLPHGCFVATYGLDPEPHGGCDPFETSMQFQRELTRRFTAEFSIRPFLIRHPHRTMARLLAWTRDPDAQVRRLCSEGCRPRLPWAARIPALVRDPRPVLPILEALKDDPELYVRRSVANHLGDIAKDHPALVFELCGRWIPGAPAERRWVVRHALRHPAKQGVPEALRLRNLAK